MNGAGAEPSPVCSSASSQRSRCQGRGATCIPQFLQVCRHCRIKLGLILDSTPEAVPEFCELFKGRPVTDPHQ
eukprot:4033288-Amphidinium_carterae.2